MSKKISNDNNNQARKQYDSAEKNHRQVQGLEKWGTRDVWVNQLNQYAPTLGVITSFHFMVQESADVSIR
jgi:hypothetical protein